MEENKQWKQLPFTMELAKKIQSGEVEGKIKTRNGQKVRILCTDVQNDGYPIVAAIMDSGIETVGLYRLDGSYYIISVSSGNDLVLEVPDNEPQFKPFDKVLVRDCSKEDDWQISFFSHIRNDWFITNNGHMYKECIPYKGNEHLLGTTNNPKEN